MFNEHINNRNACQTRNFKYINVHFLFRHILLSGFEEQVRTCNFFGKYPLYNLYNVRFLFCILFMFCRVIRYKLTIYDNTLSI